MSKFRYPDNRKTMKIETSVPVSKLTKRILKKLAKRSAVVVEFDDSLDHEVAYKELLSESGKAAMEVVAPQRHRMVLINIDRIRTLSSTGKVMQSTTTQDIV